MFKFSSETHGLNEELGAEMYGGREGSFYCASLKVEFRNGTTTAIEGRNGISRFN